MSKIKVVVDSTADIDGKIMEEFNIPQALPLIVTLGNNSYLDGVDIQPSDIFEYYDKNKKLPKTAAPSVDSFLNFFLKHTEDGSDVIYFSISSKLSTTHQSATLAARELEGTGKNVFCVDGRVLSTGTGLQAMATCDFIKNNPDKTAEEVFQYAKTLGNKTQASFCIDTLEYLYKGGRCSGLSLLGANLLRLHPSLHLKGGLITVGAKYRGKMRKVFRDYLSDLAENHPNYDATRCFITHTECDSELVDSVTEAVNEYFNFEKIYYTTAGSTITSHCGKGTLGLLFLNK